MRKGMLILLCLSFPLIILSAQSADTSDDWYLEKPIEDITFEGLDNISLTELEGIIKPYIGKKFTNPLFWDLQSALYALDFFEELLPEAMEGKNGKSQVVIQFNDHFCPLSCRGKVRVILDRPSSPSQVKFRKQGIGCCR